MSVLSFRIVLTAASLPAYGPTRTRNRTPFFPRDSTTLAGYPALDSLAFMPRAEFLFRKTPDCSRNGFSRRAAALPAEGAPFPFASGRTRGVGPGSFRASVSGKVTLLSVSLAPLSASGGGTDRTP